MMHKKIFFIMTVMLITKNIVSSSSESNTIEMTPVPSQVRNPNQIIDPRIRRISSIPTSTQHKENILNSITRILTVPNSGTIRSVVLHHRKMLQISKKGEETINEHVIFEYQNPFKRDPQKELFMSIWETRENNHPTIQEIDNIIVLSVKLNYFPSVNSILHCTSTGRITWVSDRLNCEVYT